MKNETGIKGQEGERRVTGITVQPLTDLHP
jgi:hypothetical protein